MPRPRKDSPRALTLASLGRVYVRLLLEQGTHEVPLAALAAATGVSRQSVWERAQRPGWLTAVAEAVVEKVEWRRDRRRSWRRRCLDIVADVSASLAARPLLLHYVGATCFLSPAWRPVLRDLEAAVGPRASTKEDALRAAQACLAIAVAHASQALPRNTAEGWDFDKLSDAEAFGQFQLAADLASPAALAREVDIVLDGVTAASQFARDAGR